MSVNLNNVAVFLVGNDRKGCILICKNAEKPNFICTKNIINNNILFMSTFASRKKLVI